METRIRSALPVILYAAFAERIEKAFMESLSEDSSIVSSSSDESESPGLGAGLHRQPSIGSRPLGSRNVRGDASDSDEAEAPEGGSQDDNGLWGGADSAASPQEREEDASSDREDLFGGPAVPSAPRPTAAQPELSRAEVLIRQLRGTLALPLQDATVDAAAHKILKRYPIQSRFTAHLKGRLVYIVDLTARNTRPAPTDRKHHELPALELLCWARGANGVVVAEATDDHIPHADWVVFYAHTVNAVRSVPCVHGLRRWGGRIALFTATPGALVPSRPQSAGLQFIWDLGHVLTVSSQCLMQAEELARLLDVTDAAGQQKAIHAWIHPLMLAQTGPLLGARTAASDEERKKLDRATALAYYRMNGDRRDRLVWTVLNPACYNSGLWPACLPTPHDLHSPMLSSEYSAALERKLLCDGSALLLQRNIHFRRAIVLIADHEVEAWSEITPPCEAIPISKFDSQFR